MPSIKGSYGALQELITTIELLYQGLQQTKQELSNKADLFLKLGVNMAIQKINKYFNKIKEKSPFYFAMVILYLLLKRSYFRNKWRNWPIQQKHAEKAIEEVFNTYVNKLTDEEDKDLTKER